MIKSRFVVDEDAVKKINEEINDWTAVCRICKSKISGTLSDIRKHVACHVKAD